MTKPYPKTPTTREEALQTLAAFSKEAPGRLPERVTVALNIAATPLNIWNKIGFFSHPYSGGSDNFRLSGERHRFLLENKYTCISGCAQGSGGITDSALTYKQWLRLEFFLIKACGYIIFGPGWRNSKGCYREYRYARLLKIPILILSEDNIVTEHT